jgi:hypothetical protein
VTVGAGWYGRFVCLFPLLASRKAQKLSKAQSADGDGDSDIMDLFHMLS